MSSPVFPVNGSLLMAPLFPRSGPGESGSPMSQVVLRCYDFPFTHPQSLICFAITGACLIAIAPWLFWRAVVAYSELLWQARDANEVGDAVAPRIGRKQRQLV